MRGTEISPLETALLVRLPPYGAEPPHPPKALIMQSVSIFPAAAFFISETSESCNLTTQKSKP